MERQAASAHCSPFPAILLLVLNTVLMQASAEQEFKGARPAEETIARAYQFADLSSYPPKKRFLIRAADLAFFVLIKVIGRTIRWQVEGWENWEAATRDGQVPIYTFWHNRVFLATYFWQKRRIVVMTSQSFDGEYIARFIQRFGYGAARGSSTRGAVGAIIEMTRLMRAGCPTAFTIDGPKGPRYVAKMGAVLLAKKTDNRSCPLRSPRDIGKRNEAGTDSRCPCLSRARAWTSRRQSTSLPTLTTKDWKQNAMSCKPRWIRSTVKEAARWRLCRLRA